VFQSVLLALIGQVQAGAFLQDWLEGIVCQQIAAFMRSLLLERPRDVAN
jgi:hypothetical protein